MALFLCSPRFVAFMSIICLCVRHEDVRVCVCWCVRTEIGVISETVLELHNNCWGNLQQNSASSMQKLNQRSKGSSPRELTQILHRCVDVSYGASIPCGGTRWAGGFGQRGAIGTGCLNGLALVTPYRRQAGHEGCVVLKTGWGPSGEEIIGTNIWTIRDNELQKVEQEIKTDRKGGGRGRF